MEIKIKLDPAQLATFKKNLEDKLEVAAVRGWEKAVQLTPAAGQSPYSTGRLRQSLRYQKTGDMEYTFFCPVPHGVYLEFGTGPRGKATGAMPEFENDPQPGLSYHTGEVLVTRARGQILDEPYIRHTQGMEAQPFMRPALMEAIKVFEELLKK